VFYMGATAPPDPATVCAGVGERLGADETAATAAIRASYPDDQAPPPPGSLVELVGGSTVADTPENLCRNMLYVWEHRLGRDPYGDLVRCVDDSKTPADIVACRNALRTDGTGGR
jgi:hypothetical protein